MTTQLITDSPRAKRRGSLDFAAVFTFKLPIQSSPSDPQHTKKRKAQSTNNSQRRVTFNTKIKVHKVLLPIDLYTKEEREATWFTKEDYAIMDKRNDKEIKKLDKGRELKNKKYCARGIEKYTQLEVLACEKNRKEALELVMFLQDLHRQQGYRDPKEIAKKYGKLVSHCCVWAQVLGLHDERWVDTNVRGKKE